MFLCLHHVFLLWIIPIPLWSVSVDIFFREEENRGRNTDDLCIQRQAGESESNSLVLTWIRQTNNIFFSAKHVHSAKGQFLLQTITSSSRYNYIYTEGNDYSMSNASWPLNCFDIFKKSRHYFIKTVSSAVSKQMFFNILVQEESFTDRIASTICTIISREKWDNIIVITSTNKELSVISSSCISSSQLLFTLEEETYVAERLGGIYRKLEKQRLTFVIACSMEYVLKILHQAYLLELQTFKRSRWLIIPSKERIEDILRTRLPIKTDDVIIATFSRISEHYYPYEYTSSAQLMSDIRNMNIVSNPPYASDEKKAPLISATMYSLQKEQNRTTLRRRGSIDQNGVSLIGDLFLREELGFNNKSLSVATLEFPPFVFKKLEFGQIYYSGICIDLLDALSDKLNFSYEITEPEDQEYGRYTDGNWTGLVGLLAYKKADLVIAAMTADDSRESVIDFTVPYFYAHSAVILKKQDPDADKWMTLVAPFRCEVHISIFFSVVFLTGFLFIMEEVHPANSWTDKRASVRGRRYGDILWYHFGALTANGGIYLPNTNSGRSVLACWWLFTVMSAAIYSGNLIAFLSDWREKPPFATLHEMSEQKTYRWGTLGGSIYTTLFKSSNQSVYKKIGNGMLNYATEDPDVLSVDPDVHLHKTLSGQYAYIGELTYLQMWKNQHCDLQLLQETFYFINLAVGLPNNSIYTKLFSKQILAIYESGLIKKWYEKWMPPNHCETPRSAKRVELLGLQSVFYAAGVGVVVALAVLLIEIMNHRRCRN